MMPELLQKSFTWDDPPRAIVRAVPRYVLHVLCLGCGAGFYGSAPMRLSFPCLECHGTAFIMCCVWDTKHASRPPCLTDTSGEHAP